MVKIAHGAAQWIGDREEQQDSMLVDRRENLFAVADGVSGGPGGRQASEIAVCEIHDNFIPKHIASFSKAFNEAHYQIFTDSAPGARPSQPGQRELFGMATTGSKGKCIETLNQVVNQ